MIFFACEDETYVQVNIHCVSKKCTNYETVYLRIIVINCDDIWQKYSNVTRTEFAFFSFHVDLLF